MSRALDRVDDPALPQRRQSGDRADVERIVFAPKRGRLLGGQVREGDDVGAQAACFRATSIAVESTPAP